MSDTFFFLFLGGVLQQTLIRNNNKHFIFVLYILILSYQQFEKLLKYG